MSSFPSILSRALPLVHFYFHPHFSSSYLPLVLSPCFSNSRLCSSFPHFPFLSSSYYESGFPLPLCSVLSLQICSSLHSVTNDQNSVLIINTAKAKCCTRECLCLGMNLSFKLRSLSRSTHSNCWYQWRSTAGRHKGTVHKAKVLHESHSINHTQTEKHRKTEMWLYYSKY